MLKHQDSTSHIAQKRKEKKKEKKKWKNLNKYINNDKIRTDRKGPRQMGIATLIRQEHTKKTTNTFTERKNKERNQNRREQSK